ncbi:inorganic phosphate transporter [Conexibacter sp. CPCC 206217]|uniref:inorganic phosphate transporter n=1 Tax=Conexibacter sp. CPCC 206217 TaxID=3064574 RepID=UPI002727A9E3|nr:inorganic phosphate transporter [Conexibacter sp. CPCC 206217]MDO8213369.1 inorganic phosphate transporter [Conexibacter sp. CPCC 206217]
MGSDDILLALVVAAALSFDFTNGFHDTANAMATSIATRALRPRVAVVLAGFLNFVGAFLSIAVATTIARGIVDNSVITMEIILAGLLGAILWNLATWALSLPSSSSHALIGGLVGATLVGDGSSAVKFDGIIRSVIVPAVLAPIVAGVVALTATYFAYRALARLREDDKHATRSFRFGQIGSASLVSLAHGTNDAQKTMGVITLALIVHGSLNADDFTVPLWVKLCSATAIAAGTCIGGWRIINTLGRRMTEIEAPQGFAAEASGAGTILASSYFGYPLSTTQVVAGSVLGAGTGKKLASVRWGLAGQMGLAWLLTLPAAGLMSAAAYEIADLFGIDSAGPVVIALGAALAAVALWTFAQRTRVTSADV